MCALCVIYLYASTTRQQGRIVSSLVYYQSIMMITNLLCECYINIIKHVLTSLFFQIRFSPAHITLLVFDAYFPHPKMGRKRARDGMNECFQYYLMQCYFYSQVCPGGRCLRRSRSHPSRFLVWNLHQPNWRQAQAICRPVFVGQHISLRHGKQQFRVSLHFCLFFHSSSRQWRKKIRPIKLAPAPTQCFDVEKLPFMFVWRYASANFDLCHLFQVPQTFIMPKVLWEMLLDMKLWNV